MKRRVWILSLAAAVVVALVGAGCGSESATASRYHCPMHPTYVSDRQGDCPICGMRLVPLEEGPAPTAAPTAPGAVHGRETPDGGGVPGMATVTLSADGLRLAGVETAAVVRGAVGREVRTVGTVVPDETRVRHVHTKISGWVEDLYVSFTGQLVERGEPILSIYSPQLVASQEELLRAREAAARFAASSLPEVRRGGEELYTAARRRLELFDVPSAFIEELERSGQVQRTVTLLAPVSGYVTSKGVFEGHQVEPGMELFTLTDLSRVWIEASFYEGEASSVRLGQEAILELPYDPGVALEGRVAFIEPTLDPVARTLRVRFEFSNPGLRLKPGMFADVATRLGDGEGLLVPDSAVLDTGSRQVVFVDRGNGTFEPREVRAGARSGGGIQVISGLEEGERVVIRANFLLDSESRLRSALAGSGHRHGGGS